MEKLSRVEKYKNLRESIDNDSLSSHAPTIEPVELRKQLEQLHEADSPKQEQSENTSRHSSDPLLFSKKIDLDRSYDTGQERFHNEYLDDFINEVKEYNLEKGNRISDNTQIDILMQLNPENRTRRTQHFDALREDEFAQVKPEDTDEGVSYTQSLSKAELQEEVDRLFEEDAPAEDDTGLNEDAQTFLFGHTPLVRINPVTPAAEEETAALKPGDAEKENDTANDRSKETSALKAEITASQEETKTALPKHEDAPLPSASEQRFMEETAQIRMQMDDYEDELSDLHKKVSKSNRILNVILFLLIIALIAVVGVTLFWIKEAGGF